MNVGIYVYDQAEVLDFSGPFEVFSTASRIGHSDGLFDVFLISQTGKPVDARAGFRIQPAYGFENHPPLDLLIVPGGVHTDEMRKKDVIEWIGAQADRARLTASVCTGVFLLARAEVVTHHAVTTHWEDIPDLRTQFPRLDVRDAVRWVDQGAVVTSGGISAGIDMCLHLVSRLHSTELAEKTARQMEYDWRKNPSLCDGGQPFEPV